MTSEFWNLFSLPNQKMFLQYIKIIKPFWKKYVPNFWTYFFDNYLDITKLQCYSGWQNCMREVGPTTNNSLEAFNKVIKDVMSEHRKLPFGEYATRLFEELKRRSEESALVLQFPKKTIVPNQVLILSKTLSDNFDDYFEVFEGDYFIKDHFPICSIFNPKTGKLKQKISKLA